MRHEWFFKINWLLSGFGMWYLGTYFNQLWHAGVYHGGHWAVTILLIIGGIFATVGWIDRYKAEPNILHSVNGNPEYTFYWRDWLFGDWHRPRQNVLWDEFLTLAIAACACFAAGHFAGPLLDGPDYGWFFWVALIVSGHLPIWLRHQHIQRWREHLEARQMVQQQSAPQAPTDPPGGGRVVANKSPEKPHPCDVDNVIKLRPDGDQAKLTA